MSQTTMPTQARRAIGASRSGTPMLVAAAACWGVGTVISKEALGDVAPLTLLPLQLAVSLTVLGIAGLAVGVHRSRETAQWRLAMLGVLNPGIAYALGLLGLAHMTASLSVLLWAVEPAIILGLGLAVLREQVETRVAVAIAAALLGVVLVVFQPGSTGSPLGITLVLAGVVACAVYTILARTMVSAEESLAVVIVQQAAALAFAAVVLVATSPWTADAYAVPASPGTWAAIAASGALYYGLAFWLYIAGLRRTSASVAGSFLTLIPVFGLAAGLAYGEALAPRQWVGGIVIVAGVAAIARSRPAGVAAIPPSESST